MNLEEIRTLAEIMNDTGLTTIEITEGETNIRLAKNPPAPACVPAAPMPMPAVMPAAPAAPAAAAPAEAAPATPGAGNFSNLTEVKSPMVGVFYDSPSPEADPYVKVGDKVKKGDVLCIIEAMKLMNEITAEEDGVIAEVLVDNGQVVEFSQPLFRLQ